MEPLTWWVPRLWRETKEDKPQENPTKQKRPKLRHTVLRYFRQEPNTDQQRNDANQHHHDFRIPFRRPREKIQVYLKSSQEGDKCGGRSQPPSQCCYHPLCPDLRLRRRRSGFGVLGGHGGGKCREIGWGANGFRIWGGVGSAAFYCPKQLFIRGVGVRVLWTTARFSWVVSGCEDNGVFVK